MKRDLIVALYFFFITIVALLLLPPYILAVIRFERIIIGQNCDSYYLMNDDLTILLIKQRDFNGNLFHLLFATWDTTSGKPTDLSFLGTVLWDCFGKVDLLSSWKFNSFCIFLPQLFWMRQNLILILYFLSLAFLILLMGPGYLLSVVQLKQLIREFNNHIRMPHPINQNSVIWKTLGDDEFDEKQKFNCPWTITTNNESITVNIIYLKWIFNYDFWIRVKIHPQGIPKASQLLDIDDLHPFFKSLATALLNYYEFPEPHLNEFQLHFYGELMDHLSYKVNWTTIMANTHLEYPDLALDKFSGTDPDQDAESFVQLIERKINFALGDAPADPDDLVSYTFRKKALSSSLLRRPAAYDGATQFHPRSNWGNPNRNNTFNCGRGWPFNRYQNQFVKRNGDNDYRKSSTGAPSRGIWQNIGSNPRSPFGPRGYPQPSRQYQTSRSSTPDNSVFRQSNSQESGGFVPYKRRFPRTNDQSSSHAVRFTTTDDSFNALSELCPLRFSISPAEKLKKIMDSKLNSC